MLDDEDEVTRFFQFNEEKTAVTLIISTTAPMTFHQYLEILSDFIYECDTSGDDLFNDNSYLEAMN